MAKETGTLQLVLRSKKVLVRVEETRDSFMTWDGQVRSRRRHVKVYDYVLDEGQERVLREARQLAIESGVALEVTDVSRQSPLKRMLWRGLGTGGGTGTPRGEP